MVSKTLYQPPKTMLLSLITLAVVIVSSAMFLRLGGNHQNLAGGPRLVLGPDRVSPGATISVSGFNYPASAGVKVYFQSPANGVVNTDTSSGGFFNVSLTLPQHISGTAHVYAVSGTETASAAVSVIKPFLTAASGPSSAGGDVPAPVAVNGGGFIANGPVTLTLKNGATSVSAGTVVADKLGHITINTASLNTPFGVQDTLTATDLAQNVASVPLVLGSYLDVSPATGRIGASISIRGFGFLGDELVDITFQGNPAFGGVTVNRGGTFRVRFVVPNSATIGAAMIIATGRTSGLKASFPFNVLSSQVVLPPRITPGSGRPGTTVTATGGRFTPSGTVQAILVCPQVSCVGTTLGTYTAHSDGTIGGSFVIPAGEPRGRYSILFLDVSTGATTSVPFTVR